MLVKIQGNTYSLPNIKLILTKRELAILVEKGTLEQSLTYYEKPTYDIDTGKREQIISIEIIDEKK